MPQLLIARQSALRYHEVSTHVVSAAMECNGVHTRSRAQDAPHMSWLQARSCMLQTVILYGNITTASTTRRIASQWMHCPCGSHQLQSTQSACVALRRAHTHMCMAMQAQYVYVEEKMRYAGRVYWFVEISIPFTHLTRLHALMEHYEKGGKLGEGAWGVVTAATQKSTGRKVAIKKIR
jgi:hypothetical protein